MIYDALNNIIIESAVIDQNNGVDTYNRPAKQLPTYGRVQYNESTEVVLHHS